MSSSVGQYRRSGTKIGGCENKDVMIDLWVHNIRKVVNWFYPESTSSCDHFRKTEGR